MKSLGTILLFCLSMASVTAQNAVDAQGRRSGAWSAKYPGGQPRYEGTFDAGVPVGRFVYYHENGFRSAQMDYRDRTGLCMSEQFDDKGKLMAQGKYQSDRLRDSVWTIFAFDGTRLELATYSAGDLQGAYTMFYPDGRVMERGDYDKGQKTGVWTRFSDVGVKERIATFAEGMLQGPWTEFDSNGRISVVGSYQNDMREGKWNYLERGVLLRSEVYRRGILQDPSK